MGLFSRQKKDAVPQPTSQSQYTTPVTSVAPSVDKDYYDPEKEDLTDVAVNRAHSTSHSSGGVKDVAVAAAEGASYGNVEAEQEMNPQSETTAVNEDEDNTVYPTAMKLVLITIALCLSIFCMALDNTIIATAIPKITDEFKSLNDVGWYGSAYLLCTCAFQLFFGKLYTFLSIKWVYLTAILIFEIGSAVCGAAPNSTALILGRAVAGLGSAGIFSGAVLIITNTVPLAKRPTYMGLIGGMYGIASVAGPLMGGAFTSKVTWRWCFYINLPIGALTIGFITLFYHPTQNIAPLGKSWREKLEQFDIFGTLVFLPMIVCLLLALQWGGSTYPWGSGRIIALFVVFGVLLCIFIAIQFWKQDNGTIPPRVLKQRSVASSAWFVVMLGAAFFSFIYYVPIWFQAIQNASPVQSGIKSIPMVLSLVLTSIVVGGIVQAIGHYAPFIIASSVFMAIGAGLISTFRVDTSAGAWIGYQIVFGIGVGLGMQNVFLAIQATLKPKDIPIGTAIIMFFQTLGGALFLSVVNNIFNNRLIANVTEVVPGIDPSLVIKTGATNLKTGIPSQYLAGVQVAYNSSLVSAFYVATATATASIIGAVFIEWKSIKGKKMEMHAA